MFTCFQSPGTLPDCPNLSNTMESGLAMTSGNSHRTLECISSGPIDLCTLRYLRWSRTGSSLTVLQWEGLHLPGHHLTVLRLRRDEERGCQWRLRQRSCWVRQPSPLLLIPCYHSCSLGGVCFLKPCLRTGTLLYFLKDWTRWIPEVPSNLNHSVILWSPSSLLDLQSIKSISCSLNEALIDQSIKSSSSAPAFILLPKKQELTSAKMHQKLSCDSKK